MAVSRTNLSTNLDYVSWGSSDTIKDIFNSIHTCLTNHGWTQASTSSAGTTFFNTFDPNAGTTPTYDFRRVYYAPLTGTGSGLTNKYVMLRIFDREPVGNNYVQAYAGSNGQCWYVQLIPFTSWNAGTDVGTNPAGTALTDAYNVNGSYDNHNWNNNSSYYHSKAPHTWFLNSVAGFLYISVSANWIAIWPYFASGTNYTSNRNQVLMYGELAEDFASYTNVPPVYVTTLQRLIAAAGTANTPSFYNNGYNPTNYGVFSPQFLMPAVPASTTGYTGVANTVRTGYNAHACTRVMFGHYGFFGYDGQGIYTNNSSSGYGSYYNSSNFPEYYRGLPTAFMPWPWSTTYMKMSKYGHNIWADPATSSYTDSTPNQATVANSVNQPALNSTNLKGIELIFGGGCLGSGYSGYNSNPYPMYWLLGRAFGLKYVGGPASGSWSTLDKVTMSVDSNKFYVKSGGTSTDFILIGVAPTPENAADPGSATAFFALPA